MVASNTYGRQVTVPLTNKSGGGVIAGDVVIIDTSNNEAFTTTTTSAFTKGIGIAQETIANNAVGRVLISGYAALVNVNASVTRGNFGVTYTVAKQATDAGASRTTGTFCEFLTGGTTPTAVLFGTPDGTSASATNLASGKTTLTAGDFTGTSATFATVTSAAVTITTGARRVLVSVIASGRLSSSGNLCLDLDIDGGRVGQTFGLVFTDGDASKDFNLSFTFLTDALSAGSHTFTLKYRVTGGTGTVYASAGVSPLIISAVEQYAA